MYTYADCLLLSNRIGSQWEKASDNYTPIEFLQLPVGVLLIEFRKAVLIMTDSQNNQVFFDVGTISKTDLLNFSTIGQLVESVIFDTLAPIPGGYVPPKYDFLNYYNLFQLGFRVKLNTGSQDFQLYHDRQNVAMSDFFTQGIISINGFLHRCDYTNDILSVIDGVFPLTGNRNNEIGYLDFSNLGSITTYPVQAADVQYVSPNTPLYNLLNVNMNFPFDPTTQTLFLVIGGYPYFVGPSGIQMLSNNQVQVNLNATGFIHRYLESTLYMPLPSLDIDMAGNPYDVDGPYAGVPDYGTAYATDGYVADSVIMSYMTRANTFFVVINRPNIMINLHQIRNSNFPGLIGKDNRRPVWPILSRLGRLAEYWVDRNNPDQRWNIQIRDDLLKSYVFTNAGPLFNEDALDNHTLEGIIHQQGYSLEMMAAD